MLPIRMMLAAIAATTGELTENKTLWTYTIWGFDGTPYLTRTLLPRVAGWRPVIHKIHRDDADEHCHNHPWEKAYFMIASGGYDEERVVGHGTMHRRLRPGDVNELDANTFHRVTNVQPNTWTVGLLARRVQDWGFLVEDVVVPHAEYFARRRYRLAKSEGKS